MLKTLLEGYETHPAAQQWFKRGQDSIRRKNQSGCSCDLGNDGEEVISVCEAHAEWMRKLMLKNIERCARIVEFEAIPYENTSSEAALAIRSISELPTPVIQPPVA